MGVLPWERLSPSPPFMFCAVDLFGPFDIKDTVKRRVRGKVYGVVFNCLSSRAVYIDIADGYDTDTFLMVLRRFVSQRGYPRKMISDLGSQLVAASKELKGIRDGLDKTGIKGYGSNAGMEWTFIKSADAPWENGCSEALVKSIKRCLERAVCASVMTFSELQTVFFEVANCVNERPIGTKTSDPNEGSYLCPNDLLLGRSCSKVPSGEWSEDQSFRARWKFVQQLANSFWRNWQRDYFHTLIVRKKWHINERNLRIGDIVIIPDSTLFRGEYKLAEVCEASVGRDGRVRDVSVRYKSQAAGSDYKGCKDTIVKRSAHRIVLIPPVEEQE